MVIADNDCFIMKNVTDVGPRKNLDQLIVADIIVIIPSQEFTLQAGGEYEESHQDNHTGSGYQEFNAWIFRFGSSFLRLYRAFDLGFIFRFHVIS